MRRAALLPVAVAATLTLTACGSDDDGPGDARRTTTTATSAATAPPPATTSPSATATTPSTKTGPAATGDAGLPVTGDGYTYRLPGRGWTDARGGTPDADTSYLKQGSGSAGTIGVTTDVRGTPRTTPDRPDGLANYVAEFRAAAAADDTTIPAPRRTTVGGDPALELTFGPRDAPTTLTVVVHDGLIHGITTLGDEDSRARVGTVARQVAQSWTWR